MKSWSNFLASNFVVEKSNIRSYNDKYIKQMSIKYQNISIQPFNLNLNIAWQSSNRTL